MPGSATIPSLRLLVLCILGYLCVLSDMDYPFVAIASVLILLSFFFVNHVLNWDLCPRYIAIHLILILIAAWHYHQFGLESDTQYLDLNPPHSLVLLESRQKPNGWEYLFYFNKRPLKHKKVILRSRESLELGSGDQILFNQKLNELKKPVFKGQFDYSTYLKRKGIIASAYIKRSNYTLMDHQLSYREWPALCKKSLLQSLQKYIPSLESRSILESLILGHKYNLKPDLKQKFIDNGTLHILAISGMHMGVLAGVLLFVLNTIFPYRKQKIFIVLTTTLILFGYNAITGFPPSALRASFMITLFLIGRVLMVHSSSYNIVFATALIMLLFNPSLLVDVGFQLSFFAVLSIIYFYPIIVQLLSFENILLRLLWSMISLGISAQIGTIGLSILYFNTFTPWFWIMGIPASIYAVFGMISGLALFILDLLAFHNCALWVGGLMSNISSFFIHLLDLGYSLSWHHFERLYWSPIVVLMYYTGIFLLSHYLYNKQLFLLRCALLLFLCCSSIQIIERFKKENLLEVCEVDIGAHKVQEIHYHNIAFTLNPGKVPDYKIAYHLQSRRLQNRIKQALSIDRNHPIRMGDQIRLEDKSLILSQNTQMTYIKGLEEKSFIAIH